ncbi:streptophobe family protein [Blastococcus sp. LR1]|uniref:streptophobe family protein n=1 Tax=Blastococcus sp. LR1 TaxID=2877000 RepID=UPI001CCAAA28|nr:streptophobe family protein [Blastococcus sp. LR1]MCA0144894.1 streptophobe family protein [Blastococcus sp. LR1]
MTGSFCFNCGSQAVPGGSFCATCGARLAAATVPEQPPQQQWNPPPPPEPGPPTVPRTAVVDALLTGDWRPAVRAAGLAVGAMAVLALLAVLLAGEGDLGFGEVLTLTVAAVCLAVGGDAYLEADASVLGTSAATSASVGFLPLTITLAGLVLLARSYRRDLHASPPASSTDALLRGVRTALVFTAIFLPLALLTRREADELDALGVAGQFGIGVLSTLVGALLFAGAALGLTWLFSRSVPLPGRLGVARSQARAALGGAVAVFSLGVVALLGTFIWSLIEEGEPVASLAVLLLGGGNGALAGVLLSAGVPLSLEGGSDSPVLGGLVGMSSADVDLFMLTDANGWLWLAPVLLGVGTLAVATALAVRQDTVEDARREAGRFAGALAVVAFAAALLLRISADGGGEVAEFSASGEGSVTFNPFLAAIVLAVWGGVCGLLAPVVAAKVPAGFVVAVRRRFGAASDGLPTGTAG